jgi:hypothetical protein
MAVVQISRIQQRRGRKDDGLPQLASGELAWCIDTQELFIGNGSVAEGSPAVGNTKLLTEYDNLLNLIGAYEFAKNDDSIQTGAEINFPVTRSVQQRLDDEVAMASFGVLDDNSVQTPDYRTAAMQRAIDQLYLSASRNGETSSRIALQISPGEFTISDTLYLPSFVTLVGAGKNKTIINYTGDGPIVECVDDESSVGVYRTLTTIVCEVTTVSYLEGLDVVNKILVNDTTGISIDDEVVFRGTGFGNIEIGTTYYVRTISNDNDYITISESTVLGGDPIFTLIDDIGFMRAIITVNGNSTNSTNQPQHINVRGIGLTTESNSTQGIVFNAVRDSVFDDIGLTGPWKADDNHTTTPNSRALELNSVSAVVTSERNIFKDIEITGFTYGVWSTQDAQYNKFDNLYIHGVGTSLNVHQAIVFGNGASAGRGPKNNTISNSIFELVHRHGIYISTGLGNTSIANRFVNVGNDGQGNSFSSWPHIYFGDPGNSSHNDEFDRVEDLEGVANGSSVYVPNINGHVAYDSTSVSSINLTYAATPPAISTVMALRLPMPNLNSSIPTARDNIGYEINYVYRRNNDSTSRFGRLLINADVPTDTVQLVDEYEFVGAAGQEIKLSFTARIWDTNGDTFKDTLQIFYNIASSVDNGTMSYSYRSIF